MEAATAEPELELTWRDPKRHLWLLGLVVPMIPFLAWALVAITGLGVFWWFGPFLVFGVIPFFDQVIGKDAANPPDSALKWLENDRYYRWCTFLFLPLQFASLIFACAWWASGELSFIENLGLAFSVAMVAGIAINTAHELGHKTKNGERWLSKIALAQSGYGHFFIEHNRGHHVRVATPENPTSAWTISHGSTSIPKTRQSPPNSATVIAQALRTSLWIVQKPLPTRSSRTRSRWIAEVSDPETVRGRKAQKLSPRRELAGSSGVATRTWWPRLCSMKKWP